MRQLGWIVFIAEHIIITMLPTVEDDELLAALWVAGCHQSGGLASIYDIGLGLSLHCEQFSVIPHFQQFISGQRSRGSRWQALCFPSLTWPSSQVGIWERNPVSSFFEVMPVHRSTAPYPE